VGIDWATQFHDVAVVDEQGALLEEFRVTHDAPGLERLLRHLDAAGGAQGVLLGIESGAPLLLDQLLEQDYTIYVINPRQADRFRDRHTMAGAKDDRLDAFVLADAVRTDRARMRVLERDSAVTEEIRLRDRARTRKIHMRVQVGHQLRAALARFHPALLGLGRDMDDRFFLALLRACPEPAAIPRLRMDKVRRLLHKHRIRVMTAEGVMKRLREPALLCPTHVAQACRDEALDLAGHIELLNEQIRKIDKQLEELLKRHPDRDLLLSLPGIADGLSARVIAEAGDSRQRCADSSSYQVLCGTAPVTRRSGKRSKGVTTMRRGCSRPLQAALYQIARGSRARSAWARAYHEHLRAQGKSAGVAIRALSNKWAKIHYAVLRDRTPYDEQRHVATLQARGVTWAAALDPSGTA